ncbi:hypothetical protein K474DRAFT_1713769 [Panus rudis PR-1116 ss-1]|nr:hypothetical protein K474DRAFT_1713769 [Panus rudis PR-1116 ss-1]
MSQPTNFPQSGPAPDVTAQAQAVLTAHQGQQGGNVSAATVTSIMQGLQGGLGTAPPAIGTFSGNAGLVGHCAPAIPAGPAQLAAIQPDLQLSLAVEQDRQERQRDIAAMKRAIDGVATSGPSELEGPQKRRRRQVSSSEKLKDARIFLGGEQGELDAKQCQVRQELQEMIAEQLTTLTGVSAKKSPALGDVQGDFSMSFDFTKNVNKEPNNDVLQRAVVLVHKEETVH